MTRKKITLLEVPFDLGGPVKGSSMAPSVLSALGLQTELGKSYEIARVAIKSETNNLDDKMECGVHNLWNSVDISARVRDEVKMNWSDDTILLTIGGDHTISLGTIAGALLCEENIGVIYIDAHTDINTELTSFTANAHGMPLAACMGMCKSELNDIAKEKRLKSSNVFWIGARAIDDLEQHNIEYLDNVYSYDRICTIGFENCLEDILKKIQRNNIDKLHLSFDVDVMDPIIIPATGVPEKYGLGLEDLQILNQWLRKLKNVVSVDFVEYNPLLDDKEYSVGKWCVNTIIDLIKNTI